MCKAHVWSGSVLKGCEVVGVSSPSVGGMCDSVSMLLVGSEYSLHFSKFDFTLFNALVFHCHTFLLSIVKFNGDLLKNTLGGFQKQQKSQ
jgi:hypothetical protein